jgi:hypothetical protein
LPAAENHRLMVVALGCCDKIPRIAGRAEGDMNKHIVATALCAVLFVPAAALAQSPGDDTSKPLKPGGVRVTTRAPDADKWDGQKSPNGMQRVFKCKPLACADTEIITILFSKSPTRHPDPEALEKLAKIDLPKSIHAADAAREVMADGDAKLETLSSKTATLKGYPAVVNETKLTQGKVFIYLDTTIIFAGPMMIRLQSVSKNRTLAQKSLNEFVEVMKIEEGPPGSPSLPTPTGKTEEL